MTIILRDQEHAARLFVDNHFQLAPKRDFQFHVAFGINPSAVRDVNLINSYRYEIDMLVKSTDLPSYAMTVETLNQYNRKKNVQTTIKYNPINIIFHDDNMSLINQLWQNYYNYYFADSSSAKDSGAYARNATKNFNYIKDTYGLDNHSTVPFFSYIKIYQLSVHEYIQYTLSNPIISSWNHNKVDYSQDKAHDCTMQIQYEAVSYDSGAVNTASVEGFGSTHYDTTPSPNLNTNSQPPVRTFSTSLPHVGTEYVNNLITSLNTYQSGGILPNSATSSSVAAASTFSPGLSSIVAPAQQNGLNGMTFPVAINKLQQLSSTITATLVKI